MTTRAGEWRGRGFGLELRTSFPIEGLVAGAGPPLPRPAELELIAPERLDADWPGGAERISERRFRDGSIVSSIDAHGEAGYLLFAESFGRYRISPDGRRIGCAPANGDAWRWQRYLVGQVLPFAALLQGLEVFHASAVSVGERAVAFFGPSGSGKTSLAINFALGGCPFMADDVVALETRADAVVAHAGVAVASLRHVAADELPERDRRRAGKELGRDTDAVRIAVERPVDELPLGVVYLLDPSSGGGVAPDSPVDPRALLGATFNFVIRTPRRLVRQLDLCARLAGEVPVFRVGVGRPAERAGFPRLAAAVQEHALATLEQGS
jgi:hypothetical protein